MTIIYYLGILFRIEQILKRINVKNNIETQNSCLLKLSEICDVKDNVYTLTTFISKVLLDKAKERDESILKIYRLFYDNNRLKTNYYKNILDKEAIYNKLKQTQKHKKKQEKEITNNNKHKNDKQIKSSFFLRPNHPEVILQKYYYYLEFKDLCKIKCINKYFTISISYNPIVGGININTFNNYFMADNNYTL